jgi:hypothetical protein
MLPMYEAKQSVGNKVNDVSLFESPLGLDLVSRIE